VNSFWLDADVLIQSENGVLSLEIAPPLWVFIDQQVAIGTIRSSMKIYAEILSKEHADGALAKWVKQRRNNGMFIDPAKHRHVQEQYNKIADYVAKQYRDRPAKVAEFLSGGDGWIIAHALCDSGIVVSHENRVDRTAKKPKIPNVCTRFGVGCIDLKEMLMRLKFKFGNLQR